MAELTDVGKVYKSHWLHVCLQQRDGMQTSVMVHFGSHCLHNEAKELRTLGLKSLFKQQRGFIHVNAHTHTHTHRGLIQ